MLELGSWGGRGGINEWLICNSVVSGVFGLSLSTPLSTLTHGNHSRTCAHALTHILTYSHDHILAYSHAHILTLTLTLTLIPTLTHISTHSLLVRHSNLLPYNDTSSLVPTSTGAIYAK